MRIGFNTVKGPMECYHVFHENDREKPISVVVIRDHNLSAEEMAFHLNAAEAWFRSVAKKIEERNAGREQEHARKLSAKQAG